MERAKKARTPVRASFTRTLNDIKAEFATLDPKEDVICPLIEHLEGTYNKLEAMDNQVMEAMLDEDCDEADILTEQGVIDSYQKSWREIHHKYRKKFNPRPASPMYSAAQSVRSEGSNHTASGIVNKRNFKLPKIELRKFNGELKEWMGFWSQFQKIDGDDSLHNSDKFYYLIQAMEPGTQAQEIVNSYPATGDNYPKALNALKDRFGRESLLLQVYIRELLKLVINNVTQKGKMSFDKMYIQLESHLRALETLNLETADPATWLFPLVESSLPEDILRAWQRSPMSKRDGKKENPQRTCLQILMEFLKDEFQSNQQISLAQSGFQNQSAEKSGNKNFKSKADKQKEHSDGIATVAGLYVGEKASCLFCDKSHETDKCGKAISMSLEEKTQVVKDKKSCLICLKTSHWAKNCKMYVKCVVCLKKHYVIMCPELAKQKTSGSSNPKEKSPESTPVQNVVASFAGSSTVYLGTFTATLVHGKKKLQVRALYDPGAQRSYLSSRIVQELNLQPIKEENISHSLFGGVSTAAQVFKVYQVKAINKRGGGTTQLPVRGKDKICGKLPKLPGGSWLKELKENNIWVSDMGNAEDSEIELLVGGDIYGKLLTGRKLQLSNGLTAIETVLGWVVTGGLENSITPNSSAAMTVFNMFVSEASPDQLWSLEAIGIQDPGESKSKVEREKEVKQHFLKTVSRKEDGRYTVSLPWTDGVQSIPSNKKVAHSRLNATTTKLHANGKYIDYNQIFNSWKDEGIIEEVKPDYQSCHFLPHRAVFKPESKTTPVRPVFDASCKSGRFPPLNDCLEKGPNLLELIPSILLRFRERKIGVISDIRKAFQMIEVNPDDRKFLCFLWWESPFSKEAKILQHCRVVFGVNCSPYILGAVMEYHLRAVDEKHKSVAEKLLKSLYVDNSVTSVDTYSEYEQFKLVSTNLLAEAKMELRQWECTSGRSEDSYSEQFQEESTPVLGYSWNKFEDTIRISYAGNKDIGDHITKRIILSEVQKVFDPIGFLCPALLPPKLILQQAWAEKEEVKSKDGSWDLELNQNLQTRFKESWSEASVLCKIAIPRWIQRNFTSEQFHVFGDASKDAYAAVIFLRVETEDGVSVQLVQAKSRISPLKRMTIPRLELMACTIAARLTLAVQEALEMKNIPTYFWSDSTTALAWIHRNDEWGTFVGNRVKEICSLTQPEAWRHIPGKFNPADLPSRGCTPTELLKSRWWEGPDLLRKTLGQSRVTEPELRTCLCEIEAIMNGRALTHHTDDPSDLEVLTPSLFIQDIQLTDFPEISTLDGNRLRAKFRSLSRIKEELHSRFRTEYLAELVHRGKDRKPEDFKVGDMVWVAADNKKRLDWPLARIIELLPGSDGKTRVAKIKMATGEFLRPLQRLHPMEVSHPLTLPDAPCQPTTSKPKEFPEVVPEVRTRSGRITKKPERFGC